MRKRYQIYKCKICGNIVQVLHGGVGSMVCCNKPMTLLDETTEEDGFEKHVPVVEKLDNGILVKIGSIPHPMEEKHCIEWIEAISGDHICRKHLTPGDKPEAKFNIDFKNIVVREFCTIHGQWKN